LLDLLTRHYGHDHIVLLHQRASCWFAENDLFEEALLHTSQAEDMECATELIGQAGFQLIDNQEWLRLQRWLNMLPYEAVEQNPQLLILKAWLFEVQGNRSGVSETLDKIETLEVTLNPEALAKFDVIKGHYEALGAMTAYAANDPKKALMLSLHASKNIPIQQKRALSLAHIVALGSRQLLGDLEDGLCLYKESINASEIAGSNYHSLYIALSCFIYWIDADLLSFQNTAEAAQRVLEKNYMVESAAFVNYYLGIAAYHMNDFDSAEARLSKVVYANQICNSFLYAHSSFALALVFQSRGEFVKARECCAAVTAHAIDINNDIVLAYARGFSVELELRRGEFKEASRWMKGFHAKPFSPPYLFYLPELTLVKALLTDGTMSSFEQASNLLDDLGAFLTSIHNKVFMIDVLALQALLCAAQGGYAAALDKLDEAITLAESGHWLRPFLDLGAAMKVLLLQMHKQGRNLDYVEQILSAFEDHGVTLTSPRLSNAGDNKIRLTNREIEVLMLVGRRLTDKEVAKELSISFETVRAHMKNIRKKMKVSSRVLAVDRAVELKLLSLSKI
jgi:LuxR family maltose regulon positive regulatory protein